MNTNPENSMSRIVVPLDGSTTAEVALPYAVALARAIRVGLDLVRVVEPRSPRWARYDSSEGFGDEDRHEVVEAELAAARDYLEWTCHRTGGEGVEMRSHVLEGDPAPALEHYVENDPGVIMLAMTTHGRSGAGRWPLGSVTEKMLCATTKPLLVVRPREGVAVPSIHSYARILVPLDGSVLAEQALEQARTLALHTGAALLLLSVVPSPEEMGLLSGGAHLPVSLSGWQAEVNGISCYLQRVARELCERTPGLPVEIELVAGRPAEAILTMSEQGHCGLIVMSTHGLNTKENPWRGRTRLGSIALKVVQSAVTPVLLVRSAMCELAPQIQMESTLSDLADSHTERKN